MHLSTQGRVVSHPARTITDGGVGRYKSIIDKASRANAFRELVEQLTYGLVLR